jgi:hypothetical protein
MKSDIKFVAGIIIRGGKGYITTKAVSDQGAVIGIDPVYIVNITSDELTERLSKMRSSGNPQIPHPKDLSVIPQVTLKAAKVKSWNKMSQNAAAYSIVWRFQDVILDISKPNSKFDWDITRTRHFPPNTDIREVVQAILDDVKNRPELLG